MNKIDLVDKASLKKDVSDFKVGDEVKVHLKVKEGEKTRVQIFAGTVIRRKGSGVRASFTVLKEVRGDLIEKIFPLHSPQVEKVSVTSKGKVKKAKLYHLVRKFDKK